MSAPSGAVVAAVDGQTGGARALEYAVTEAVRGGDGLHLVHVWPVSSQLDPVSVPAVHAAGRAFLDRSAAQARDLAPGVPVTTELILGPRVPGILSGARGSRLLVVGRSHQRGAALAGTAAALAGRAECPVVIVPPAWPAGSGAGRVVVGMKTSTHAAELLSHAFEAAEERDATVSVVTAWELYDPDLDRAEASRHADEWAAEGVRVLDDLVRDWRARRPGVTVDLQVTHGRAAAVLEDASADADLLLLARRRHPVPPRGHLGGVTRTLLRTSRCPVEVVPTGLVAGEPVMATRRVRPT